MVLPDVVLLKDYIETRKLLLERLSIRAIDWWGMPFADAVIDAATIVGAKAPPQDGHMVSAVVHDPEAPVAQEMRQADFWSNPRLVFNLHLTPEKRAVLQRAGAMPAARGLSLRSTKEFIAATFATNFSWKAFWTKAADRCIFGRDEIQPYLLRWNGKYIRLNTVPQQKTKERYANAGNPDWYATDKLLVRRTGDYVLAAVDRRAAVCEQQLFHRLSQAGM